MCVRTHVLFFSVGGYDGQNFLNTVECYDPSSNQWCILNPMTCRRSKCISLPAYTYIRTYTNPSVEIFFPPLYKLRALIESI